jgi:hypothetical protein
MKYILILAMLIATLESVYSNSSVYEGSGVFELIESQAEMTPGWYILTNITTAQNNNSTHAMGNDIVSPEHAQQGLFAVPLISNLQVTSRRIINPNDDMVWKIEPDGNRFTFREFSGSNRFVTWISDNQVGLLVEPTARSRWSIEWSSLQSAFNVDVFDGDNRILVYRAGESPTRFGAVTIPLGTTNQRIQLYKWNPDLDTNQIREGSFARITNISDFTDGYYVITGFGPSGSETEGNYAMNNDHFRTTTGFMRGEPLNHTGNYINNPSLSTVWFIQNVSTDIYTIREANGQRFLGVPMNQSGPSFIHNQPSPNHHWQLGWDAVTELVTFSNVAFPTRFLRFRQDVDEIRFNNVGGTTGVDLTLYRFEPNTEPLNIILSSFSTLVNANQTVSINWSTESENNMLGFSISRNSVNTTTGSLRINCNLIMANNTSTHVKYAYTDRTSKHGDNYYYWLIAHSVDGTRETFFLGNVMLRNCEPNDNQPQNTSVISVFPNPLPLNTDVAFDISVKEHETAIFKIFNIRGQLVRSWDLRAGRQIKKWNQRDNNNRIVPTGVYFYQLQSQSTNIVQKMMIVK